MTTTARPAALRTGRAAITRVINAVIYLRLSELRDADLDDDGDGATFVDREQDLRELADDLGWNVVDVLIENDVASKDGKQRPASAWKRRVVTVNGRKVRRVVRPKFHALLEMLWSGRANAILTEHLDRLVRDPHDGEELIDVAEMKKINARSLTEGSLTLTDGGTEHEIDAMRKAILEAHKASNDTARRVRLGRKRKARRGEFGGGRRPFGFEADGITVRPVEAAVIADCSRRVLQIDGRKGREDRLTSLASLALELRAGDVPTVTGVDWSAEILREILMRARNAGIQIYCGKEIGPAKWKDHAPVTEDTYRAVVALLTDPTRNTAAGTVPRWVGSGVYRCGVCNDGTRCQVGGGTQRAPRYICSRHNHLARNAALTDAYVRKLVVGLLARKGALEKLCTVTDAVIDVGALREEALALSTTLNDMAVKTLVGKGYKDWSKKQTLAASAAGNQRLAEIEEELAAVGTESPFTALLGAKDIAATYDLQPLGMRRAMIDYLMDVTIQRTGQQGRGFNPDSMLIVTKVHV